MSRSILGSKKTAKRAPFKKRHTANTEYSWADPQVIPEGTYLGRVTSFKETETKKGYPAYEVRSELTSSKGKKYYLKNVLRDPSGAFDEFVDAVFEAGLTEEATDEDVVGLKLNVTIVYPAPPDFGVVTYSAPDEKEDAPPTLEKKRKDTDGSASEDNDDEDDEFDFLLDEDEE